MRDWGAKAVGRASPARAGSFRFPWVTVLTLSAGLAGLATFALREDRARTAAPPSQAGLSPVAALLDPAYSLGHPPATFAASLPLSATWQPAAEETATAAIVPAAPRSMLALASLRSDAVEAPSLVPQMTGSAPLVSAPLPMARPDIAAEEADEPASAALGTAPLPVRRPADIPTAAAPDQPQVATRRGARGAQTAAAPAAPAPDGRSFLERLFGNPRSPNGPELAYAPPTGTATDAGQPSFGTRLGFGFNVVPKPPAGTAIFDIAARTVYLPNGERLEAQSGLGAKMNDVRYAHVRMEGPIPPHTYDLVEREALFHGVRAIRLHPTGGSQAIHGRAGLLAHSYLMGPRGDSNGCLSIKDYDRFLQAYLRGEIRRLVVVARTTS
jgi:hypothetical protein